MYSWWRQRMLHTHTHWKRDRHTHTNTERERERERERDRETSIDVIVSVIYADCVKQIALSAVTTDKFPSGVWQQLAESCVMYVDQAHISETSSLSFQPQMNSKIFVRLSCKTLLLINRIVLALYGRWSRLSVEDVINRPVIISFAAEKLMHSFTYACVCVSACAQ